jgi:hypothetical protein
LIKYEYNFPIHNLCRYWNTAQKGKYEKFQAGNRYTNELSKILEEFPPGEEEYPGILLYVNRNTN